MGLVGLLVLAALGGCRRERDHLGNPIDGSHRVLTIAVLDAGSQTLWRVSAPRPGVRSAENLVYGEVPDGFAQAVPSGAAKPRLLVQDEPLIVVIVTPEYVYRGECKGSDKNEPRCGKWESARFAPAAAERALRGEKLKS